MIQIGSLDRITSIIGERGTGKSTLAKIDARDFQRSTGGLVIGHSPNGQIGFEHDIQFADSFRALEKNIRRAPEQMHFLASGGTPEMLIDFGRTMAIALRKRGHEIAGERFHPTRPAPTHVLAAPVLIVIDEGTHTDTSKRLRKNEEAGSTAEQKELEKFLTSARHENIAVTWLIQAPTARSWVFLEQSNRARVFRYQHEWGLNSVRAAWSLDRETLERIRTQPKYHYYHFDKDTPERAGFRTLPPPA